MIKRDYFFMSLVRKLRSLLSVSLRNGLHKTRFIFWIMLIAVKVNPVVQSKSPNYVKND